MTIFDSLPPIITILIIKNRNLLQIEQRFTVRYRDYQLMRNNQEQSQNAQLKKKFIIFRNPKTNEIISEVQIPRVIKINDITAGGIEYMPSRLRMLYIDVLCRGYHPVRGFQTNAKNVFQQYQMEDKQNKLKKYVNLIHIANNQAIGTIWRCLAREVGRPLKNYNMKNVSIQLNRELQKLRTLSSLSKTQQNYHQNDPKMIEYEKLQQDLSNLETKIKLQMKKIIQRCKLDEQMSKQTRDNIVKVMEEQIIKLQRQIFLKSMVGIRQFNQNTQLIQFVMQQCYPNISMSKKKGIEALGQELFDQKKQRYQHIKQKYGFTNQIVIVCHRCMKPLQQFARVGTCDDSNATRQISYTILTDPYTYSRQIINQNCWEQDTRKYIHPYLVYYTYADSDTYICNRYYCNKCEGAEVELNKSGTCGYCQGTCDCSRCQSMDSLTKMMAVFVDNGGNLQSLISKFMMKFDTKRLETVNKKNVKIRIDEFPQYNQVFHSSQIICKHMNVAKFQKIYYYPERIQEDVRIKYEKAKMKKVKLAQEDYSRRERERTNTENKLKSKNTKKVKKSRQNQDKAKADEGDKKEKKESQSDRNRKTSYREGQSGSEIGSESEDQKQEKQKSKQKEPIDCYYEDSDS